MIKVISNDVKNNFINFEPLTNDYALFDRILNLEVDLICVAFH